jgi:phage shock protein PspC (stress-responsive transcriptional regulator)
MNYDYKSSERKLTKDVENGKLTGVCAGLANYFLMPKLAVRIIVVLCFISFMKVAAIAYIGAALFLPKR